MTPEERHNFWKDVEDNALLSAMSSLVERWGLPAIVMALGDISVVLSEDAHAAENLSPQQRSMVISACSQVSDLSDRIHAEMDFLTAYKG